MRRAARAGDSAPNPDAFGTLSGSAGDEPAPADAPPPGGELAAAVDDASGSRPKRGRGRPSKAAIEAERSAAETARALAEAARGGATIAYTLAGAGVQVVGFNTAGFIMQAQAEPAGAAIADRAKGTRFYGMFTKLGAGSTLAPFIVGPMLAEAYVRMPLQRLRLLPMLALLVPQDALEQIVAVFPVPDGPPVDQAPAAAQNGSDPAADARAEWDAAAAAAKAAAEWPDTSPAA